MNKQLFQSWFQQFGKAWVSQDTQRVMSLFSKDVQYYESALGEPCASWEDVSKLWEVVPKNQKDITFDFEVVAVADDVGIANWQVTRTLVPSGTNQKIDGIFLVTLNKDGLCDLFKQWRTTKE